jgi:tetratricopeptide (TPR) repeat protein
VGAWARREAVLVSCLAAAAAIVLLAGPLGAAWLRIAGAVIAAAGALARVVIAVQRARLEGEREKAESAGRLRVAVSPIGEIDPTGIGVDPAAQTILAGGVVPDYVGRTADDALREAVAAALDGRGPWLIVVVGGSKVGKSRTLFEALRQSAPIGELECVAPVDGDALRSLLKPGQSVGQVAARAVLWLDDLEPFLNQGVTLQTLREWHAGIPGRIVAAAYGGKGSELIARSSSGSELATLAFDVLQHARQVSLEVTTARELSGVRSRLSDQEFEDVERHGLAAYLVAGPALERKLTTGRHAPGEDTCPEGVTLVYAATDWARCGRTDPLSEEMLRSLWASHLRLGMRATDEALNIGLAWALQPVAGTIALLERTDSSYHAYDYVVRLVRDKPGAEPPRDPSWTAALQTATDVQAFAVALAAYECFRFEDAMTGFARARESSIDELAAIAGFNLGVGLGELGRSEEAISVYDELLMRFADAPEPALREQVATALVNKGVGLGELGRSEEAISVYDELLMRFADAPEPALRDAVAWALSARQVAEAQAD